MNTLLKLLVLLLLSAGASQAQIIPAVTAQPNTVYVGADGKFEAAPDTALLRLDLASQQDTSRAAYDKVAAAADQVRKVMRDNGLDPKLAQVGFYAVQPMYDWKNPKRRVVGYRVDTSVTLKLRDFAKIGALTEQLANIEEAQNQSLSYDLDDVEQAKAKATDDAFKKARTQASAVATAGGRALGELVFASVDVNQPVVMPMRALGAMVKTAAAATPAPTAEFTPQNVTINAHVSAIFALR